MRTKYLLPTVLSVVLFVLTIFTYAVFISDKYYPQTLVGDTNISFLTEGQATRLIQAKINQRIKQRLDFVYPQQLFQIDPATSSAGLDYSVLSAAFNEGRTGSLKTRAQKQLRDLFFKRLITPQVNLNLDKQIATIQKVVEKEPINAQLTFDEITSEEGTPSARIQIKEGIDGLKIDKEALNSQVAQFILAGKYNPQLPLKVVPPKVTTAQILMAKQALEETAKESIKLRFDPSTGSGQVSWTLDAKQLLTLLDLESGSAVLLDKDQTYMFLERTAAEVNQEVQEGLFEFNPTTKRVSSFRPSQEGRKLDLDQAFNLLSEAVKNGGIKVIDLPVEVVKPKVQTEDVNSLGIKELLGKGISHFAGSIPNRIYNVSLTAQKINGVLVPPNQTFSFNQTVGDITAATGFKQAYVIKGGRTVLDDGGGVCQDSTTLFRAVLNAGLPVVKRTAHAYRVGYYEQGFPPGLDATVFYPSVDFQFKNDTQHHILIQAYTVGTTLYVDLYGTNDGRVASISKSIITNQIPPPPELRQDDPTLPKGTVKQVDWSAWGATVAFSRTVTRAGETLIKETFKSNYKAWQAVYLIGTQ